MSTRGELETAVSSWLKSDGFTAADFDTAIEAVTNRLGEVLRSEANETVYVEPAGYANGVLLQPDFRAMRSVEVAARGGPKNCASVSREYLNRWVAATGSPAFYCIDDGRLWLAPFSAPELTYYYWRLPAAIGSNPGDTNEVLTAHPRLYRYGVAFELSMASQEWEVAEAYDRTFYESVAEINRRRAWSASSPAAVRA